MSGGTASEHRVAGLRQAVCIGGPTASGKSAVAIEVARRLGGEIIAVDSMQVYRGLDIGTAKPSAQDRDEVPHHLLDEVALSEEFNVARYVERAIHVLREILGRKRLPVFCGGTGLYYQVLTQGIGSAPEVNLELRRSLERAPLERLLAELAAGDPETFRRVDRRNARRVVRAVELLRLTGRGTVAHQAVWVSPGEPHPGFFVLRRSAADLRQRIDRRIEHMFRRGWVKETERLLGCGLGANRVALQALGYRQIVEHLHGARGLHATKELIKQRTRQFARRQRNWFERRLPAQPLDVPPFECPEETAQRLISKLPRALAKRRQAEACPA